MDQLVSAGIALVSAFIGAVSTYVFQIRSERKREKIAQHGAIVRAQGALVTQYNVLKNIDDQFLAPAENLKDRHFRLVFSQNSTQAIHVDFSLLNFLLSTSQAELFLQIHVAESSFANVVRTFDERNKVLGDFHSSAKLQQFDPETGLCRVELDDPRKMKMLKDVTDSLYVSVESAQAKVSQCIKDLRKAGKTLYPKETFLSLEDKK